MARKARKKLPPPKLPSYYGISQKKGKIIGKLPSAKRKRGKLYSK